MSHKLELHKPECGDWCYALLDGELIYSGHSKDNPLVWGLCEKLDVIVEDFYYEDEEYQEKFC